MDQIVSRKAAPAHHDGETVAAALGLDASGRPAGTAPRRRRLVVGAVVAVVLAGAAAFFMLPASAPTLTYQTAPATRGTLVVEVVATGTLEPRTKVEISTELSGVVASVAVEENQQVSTGDVLAILDTTRIAAQIERAEANVAAAAARVTDARVTLTETSQALARAEQLASRGMTTEQAREIAQAAFARAESAVEIARANEAVAIAELRLQQADLDKSTIYAPIDGVVLTRSLNPGQTVSASTQAPVLFVIAEDLRLMELKAAIDEADIGKIETGQNAGFTVDAFPERRFDATIRDVAFASVVTEGVVTYQARLEVENPDFLLRPGMTAMVDIITRQADDALLVPAAAFRYAPPAASMQNSGFSLRTLFSPSSGARGMRGSRPGASRQTGPSAGQAGARTLHVLQDGQPQPVRVTTGANDGRNVEILSGLDEGATVILSSSAR